MKKKYFLGLIYRVDNDLIYNKILNDKNEIGGVKNSFIQIQFSKNVHFQYMQRKTKYNAYVEILLGIYEWQVYFFK